MKRKINLDILKTIGLLCIILAHINPPKVLFQIRNFDVVLMIIISAYLGLSNRKIENPFSYIGNRFCRLVIPCWLFLLLFF